MVIQVTDAYIDGLVQERCNSIANALELIFLTLTHLYVSSGLCVLNEWISLVLN